MQVEHDKKMSVAKRQESGGVLEGHPGTKQISVLVPHKGHHACRKKLSKFSPWIPASDVPPFGVIDLITCISALTGGNSALARVVVAAAYANTKREGTNVSPADTCRDIEDGPRRKAEPPHCQQQKLQH